LDIHREHEQKLAAALRNLVEQIDINDYRDSMGHDAKKNRAFRQAQAIVEEFCLTHEDLCAAMHEHGYDVDRLTRHFAAAH
jgi:hypothetical protein